LLGGLGNTIQWLGEQLGGLIDKALKFIGLKDEVQSVNSSAAVSRMWDRATGNVSQEQTNTFYVQSANEASSILNNNGAFFSAYD
jgi:hypothetical protein